MTDRATGESQTGTPPSAGSFGDAAAEMANETEVEEPVAPRAQHDETEIRVDADVDPGVEADVDPGVDTGEM